MEEESSLIIKVKSLIQYLFEENGDPFTNTNEDDENDIFVFFYYFVYLSNFF